MLARQSKLSQHFSFAQLDVNFGQILVNMFQDVRQFYLVNDILFFGQYVQQTVPTCWQQIIGNDFGEICWLKCR